MAAPLDLCWKGICKARSPCISFLRTKITKKESDFSLLIKKRYLQAKQSVVVRTHKPQNTVRILQKFDDLNSAHYISSEEVNILAEYKDEVGVQRLLDQTTFFPTSKQFPIRSRCIYDDSSKRKHPSHMSRKSVKICEYPKRAHGEYPVLGSLEKELVHLYRQRSLTDLDIRLRFMMCLLLEEVLKTLSPEIRVVPFGSCLNGTGWWDSDLDMMVYLHKDPFHQTAEKQDSSMKFLSEVCLSERSLAHRTLSMLAALLELIPRTSRVLRILHARVPIIRFKNMLLGLECDVSFQAVDSIRMTELLYLLTAYEDRLKLLMCVIKEWAVGHSVTSSGERKKPTTLGLCFLLIFYLQNRCPPVLPTLRQLQSCARNVNTFLIEEVRYQLPTSPSLIPSSANTESIGALLHGFFEFFSTFDFENQGISIVEGCAFPKKMDDSPLLVENPLCVGLNICKNVSLDGVEHLQEAMAETALVLERLRKEATPETSWLSSVVCKSPPEDVTIEIESILSDFKDSEGDEAHVSVGEEDQKAESNNAVHS